jgi:hypothetical protein
VPTGKVIKLQMITTALDNKLGPRYILVAPLQCNVVGKVIN